METNAPAARCWRKRVSREREAACSETYRACLLNAERFSGRVPGFKAQPPIPLPSHTHGKDETRGPGGKGRTSRQGDPNASNNFYIWTGKMDGGTGRGGGGERRLLPLPPHLQGVWGKGEVPKVRGCGAAKRRNMRVAPFRVRISDV